MSPETRAVAKRAAHRAGKTLGEWVDDTLRRAATERLTEALPAVQEAPDTAKALETVLGRLEALESASQARSVPRPSQSFWRRFLGLSERA